MEQQVRQSVALAAKLRLAGGGDASGAVPVARTNSSPTRRAPVSPRARCWPTPSACASASTNSMCFKTQAEMAALFADLPGALAKLASKSPSAATWCSRWASRKLPNFPTPDGMTIDEFLVAESKAGLEAAPGAPVSRTRQSAKRSAPRYEERLKFETDTIIKMKFPGLLPDRGRVHPVGQEQRRAGRAGPRLGRRLAGGLCAVDHRPRSADTTTCCSSAS